MRKLKKYFCMIVREYGEMLAREESWVHSC